VLGGKMRWFNETRGDGMIECEDGEGYQVLAADFVTAPPVGRCAGLEVTFRAAEPGHAVEVVLLCDDGATRRARLRSHRVMRGPS
jgi:hypothetical protein